MVLGVFQGFFSVILHAWTSRLAGLYEMALAVFRDSVVPGRLYLLASLLAILLCSRKLQGSES